MEQHGRFGQSGNSCLTSMEDDLQFVDAERDTPEIIAEREHWLNVMQFIHDSDAVTLDGTPSSLMGSMAINSRLTCVLNTNIGYLQEVLSSITKKPMSKYWSALEEKYIAVFLKA